MPRSRSCCTASASNTETSRAGKPSYAPLTKDSLTQMARHLVDTQNWELVLYGIRIYSLLLARIEPSADYFFFLEQVKKMIA